jgi:osmotically-inducible protein OsmY
MTSPTACTTPMRSLRIADAAKDCLRSSSYHALRGVTCTCDRGVLVLTGHLSSFYYKQLAQEAVASVQGVSRVVNDIEVS